MKTMPLIYKQLIVLIVLFICLFIGVILTFGEVKPEYPIITFIVVKALGLTLLAVAIAIFRGIVPSKKRY